MPQSLPLEPRGVPFNGWLQSSFQEARANVGCRVISGLLAPFSGSCARETSPRVDAAHPLLSLGRRHLRFGN